MRENTRPVSFSTVVTDTEPLMKAVQVTFSDVLQPGQDFFLQVKCEEWEGAFVDLVGSQEIADRSLIRAVIKPAPEVSQQVFRFLYSLLSTYNSSDAHLKVQCYNYRITSQGSKMYIYLLL